MSRKLANTFAQLTADGQSAALAMPGDVCDVDVYVADAPTWGGGTLILQTSFDGGTTWVAVPSASYTSGDGVMATGLRVYGNKLRLSLSGSTSPAIDVTIKATAVSQSFAKLVAETLTDNGNTDFVLNKPCSLAVFVKGTWDSGSLTLSVSPDGTLYVDSAMSAITADGGAFFANAAADEMFRLVLASVAGAAADLDVWVFGAPL